MTSSEDLARAMKTALDQSGDLTLLRVQLEEEMLEAFNRLEAASEEVHSEHSFQTKHLKPPMPPEVILANNLVRQYLEHVGLEKTAAVLCAESGMPDKPVPENVLKSTFPSLSSSNKK